MTARECAETGFAMVEILVALLLFALIATPTARTLAIAQRSRVASGRWMQATELAGELLEQLRAGADVPESQEMDGFSRSWQCLRDAYDGVDRYDATVRWSDGAEREVVLTSLLRSRP